MSDALTAIAVIAIIFIGLLFTGCTEEIQYADLSEVPHDRPNIIEPTDNKINLYVDFDIKDVNANK